MPRACCQPPRLRGWGGNGPDRKGSGAGGASHRQPGARLGLCPRAWPVLAARAPAPAGGGPCTARSGGGSCGASQRATGELAAFLPLLKKAAQGSSQKGLSCSKAAIVNISSVLGSIERVPETFFKPVISYRCSKAALNMLTRCQALSYAEDGILCAAVHPGWVQTDMGTQKADLPVDESVRGILTVLPTLSEKHSGSFWSWAGETIPW
ncbi:C-signal-like isoform X2 [Chrysemys picta bellii]|uniref:C-signal-like isoform X2 n=1 Tax=Chrysemys picta bellii TaxID=8478 RepID=UPI0032B21C33